jgi:tRNA pseudouridine38/39 synthase
MSGGAARADLSREALAALSREQLVDLVLRGSSSATHEEEGAPPPSKKQRQQQPKRAFDMSKHAQRHVALRVAYIGTAYQGFAWQSEVGNVALTGTVEGMLIHALTKTCLITDRESCGISCGGRTDKGVSAVGQVVALRVRSNLLDGVGFVPAPASVSAEGASSGPPTAAADGARDELDYVRILNRVLPSDVRVLSWRPTDADFSARFSATGRTYKYFFQRRQLDVERMRAAAQLLVGEHDLRNFCKIDPNVTNFRRTIHSFDVAPVAAFAGGAPPESPEAIWEFTVHGTAFLYHQVRATERRAQIGARCWAASAGRLVLALAFAGGEGAAWP